MDKPAVGTETSPQQKSYIEQLQAAAHGEGVLHIIERISTGQTITTYMAYPDDDPNKVGIALHALQESAWQTYPDGVRYGGVVSPAPAAALISQYELLNEAMAG